MDNEQLTNKYLKSVGKVRTSGRTDTMSALLPFIIMDEEHDIFLKNIYRLNNKQMLRKIANEWSDTYTQFSAKRFFKVFTEEEMEYIQDKMDSFHDYIHNYIVILKVELLNAFRDCGVPEDKQDVLSAGLICNTLAQAASVVWKANFFRNSRTGLVGEDNPNLDRIKKLSMDFINTYHKNARKVNLNDYPKSVEAMVTLCHKLVMWLEEDVKNE